MELLELFDRMAMESTDFHLAFCGPGLDDDYAKRLLAAIEGRPWASYLGTIAPEAMADAMRGADVVVNNSHTEGLANALLEAATIGIPILARDIPGNAAVVTHGINGLLYNDETVFSSIPCDYSVGKDANNSLDLTRTVTNPSLRLTS